MSELGVAVQLSPQLEVDSTRHAGETDGRIITSGGGLVRQEMTGELIVAHLSSTARHLAGHCGPWRAVLQF